MASIAGLESFLAVARTGNLTAAARELHVTQPGLTARLQRLEAELGAASTRAPQQCATWSAVPVAASRSARPPR